MNIIPPDNAVCKYFLRKIAYILPNRSIIIEKGVGTHSQEYEFLENDIDNYLKSNNYLIKLAKIIYFTFLNNKENLSYEIIQNCKNNLNFNYKKLSLENYSNDNPDEALNPSTEAILLLFDRKRLVFRCT